MITIKQIEKHKFFTTNGTDIWKVQKIDQITAVELINCETAESGTCILGEDEAKKFHPVRMPKIDVRGSRGEGRGKVKKKKGTPTKEKITEVQSTRTRRGYTKGKGPSSKYFGVTVKTTKKGEKRFYAQVTKKGKWTNLGCHRIEELAAAAVQEYLGNTEEAARLRKLAEKKTDEKIKEVKGVTAFDCVECGKGYPYKPDVCSKCGHSSFSPAKPEESEVKK